MKLLKLLLIMTAVMAVALPVLGQNLIVNPGFETGNLNGWTTAGTGVTFGTTNVAPHAGTYTSEFAGTDGSIAIVEQTVNVTPNTTYYAAVYFKTQGTPVAIDSKILEQKADGSYAGTLHSMGIPASNHPGWTIYTITFKTGPDTGKLYWTSGMNVSPGNKIFMDDFKLVALTAPNGIVYNPGFEVGDYTGWNLAAPGATWNVTANNPHGGSLVSEAVGTNGALNDLVQVLTVKPNTTYYAELWIKTIAVPIAFDSHFDEYNSAGVYQNKSDSIFGGTWGSPRTQWTSLNKTFTTGPNTTRLDWYNRSNIQSGCTVFLDDFKVVEFDPNSRNWDFESGLIPPWTQNYSGVEFTNYSINTAEKHGGLYAVEGKAGPGIGGIQAPVALENFIPLLPNTTYVMSFWYKTNWFGENGHITDVRFVTKASGGATSFNHVDNLGASPDWVQKTYTWTTGANVVEGGPSLSTYQGTPGEQIWFDDFVVTKVQNYATVGALTKQGEGAFGTVNVVVTRGYGSSLYYVTSLDRTGAMLVEAPSFPLLWNPGPGDLLHLEGKLAKAIDTTNYKDMLTFQPTTDPGDNGIGTAVGAIDATLKSVYASTGLDMTAYFVRVCGTVSGSNEAQHIFYIDDGTGTPIKVTGSSDFPFPADGQFVTVTGNVASNNGEKFIQILSYGQIQIQ